MIERTLQEFRGMDGPYGVLTVIGQGSVQVDFRLTTEFVRLSRDDAQEMVRVLAAWLAAPRDTQVVRTHGADSEVYVVDNGPGAPSVHVEDDDARRPHAQRHYDASSDDGEPRRRPT